MRSAVKDVRRRVSADKFQGLARVHDWVSDTQGCDDEYQRSRADQKQPRDLPGVHRERSNMHLLIVPGLFGCSPRSRIRLRGPAWSPRRSATVGCLLVPKVVPQSRTVTDTGRNTTRSADVRVVGRGSSLSGVADIELHSGPCVRRARLASIPSGELIGPVAAQSVWTRPSR